jgi:hypothetical protein
MKDFYTMGTMIEKLENSLLMIKGELQFELSRNDSTNWEKVKDLGYKSYALKKRINELNQKRLETLRKGADVSNFGDPVEWQKKEREDRKMI